MNLLITGAAGFLGLHLANYIAQPENKTKYSIDKIYLLDIAEFPTHEYHGDFEFIDGDVRDEKLISELMKKIDYVIHGAAALPLESKEEVYDTNVNGTKNILKNAFENNIKRMIHISSTAVYGVPKVHPIHEDDPKVGVGAYGESKILAEKSCFEYIQKGMNLTIIRPKTFIGTHRLGVFEILFDWVHDGKRIPVIGNGQNPYQLMDVDDLVEASYLFFAEDKKEYNDAFNIGAEEFVTVEKDLEELFKYAKSGSRILKTPSFPIKKALWLFDKLGLSPLYQWVYDTADKESFVSIDKIKKTLNWKPKSSNADAFVKSYQWYLENYDDIKSRTEGVSHTVGWKQGILGFFKRFL